MHETKQEFHKCLLNDLSIPVIPHTNKTKMPFVLITVYIHFVIVLIQLVFGLRKSSSYLFIVLQFFRFCQSSTLTRWLSFTLFLSFRTYYPKHVLPLPAMSSAIFIIMPSISFFSNFFIQVINNNSGQCLSLALFYPQNYSYFFSY